MYHVCIMYVSCMHHVCIMYVCIMYVSCMYHVSIMYVGSMYSENLTICHNWEKKFSRELARVADGMW